MNKDLEKFGHYDLLFPSDYAKASDLGGKDLVVQIRDIEPRHKLKTAKGTEARPLVHFSAHLKPMVLNKTNGKTLRKLFGPEVTAWVGQSVTLYTSTVDAFGEQVEAIRVRQTAPRQVETRKSSAPQSPADTVRERIAEAQTLADIDAAADYAKSVDLGTERDAVRQQYRERRAELEHMTSISAEEPSHDPVTGEVTEREPGQDG